MSLHYLRARLTIQGYHTNARRVPFPPLSPSTLPLEAGPLIYLEGLGEP